MPSGKSYAVPKPESVPGLSMKFDSDGDNTAQSVTTVDSRLYSVVAANVNAKDAFIQLFDVAKSGVTVGTTVPTAVIPVPKGDATNYGFVEIVLDIPIEFNTAITYACSDAPTTNGDPTVGLTVTFLYAS